MMRTAFFSMVIILAICGCERGAPAGGTVNPGAAQTTGRPAHPDQLYIEVSAVGGSEYWAEHKLGLKLAGVALGVRTEYLGPADYDLEAMATALVDWYNANQVKDGVNATPTFLVNGEKASNMSYAEFSKLLDAKLN